MGSSGPSQGRLYVGPMATNNSHYSAEKAQRASLGEMGFYNVQVTGYSFNGKNFSANCGPAAMEQGQCIVDTGTPTMTVPMEVMQSIAQGATGPLQIMLAGSDGKNVTLDFDAATLAQKQWLEPYQD